MSSLFNISDEDLKQCCSCGNVGKLTRICSEVSSSSFSSQYPRKSPDAPFLVLGGFTDFIVPSAFVGAHGAITGLANVAPVSRNPNSCVIMESDAPSMRR